MPRVSAELAAVDFRQAIAVSNEFAPARFTDDAVAFELTVKDDSNAPEYLPGFKLIVSPSTEVLPGKYVFASVGAEKKPFIRVLKRQRNQLTGLIEQFLIPRNEAWEEIKLDPSVDVIIGPITEISRKA